MMGIYLGQLPPAEVARFKAELAETLVANFCYPRFFDYRTESLHMRPVGRAKRQEVWLYLSSVDFTAWSRVDLTTAEFQHRIEGLFIQFMQRNRSFFGLQGRRRMSDVRMLLSSCAGNVAQGLRSHLMGQRQGNPPFGSPRPTILWSATSISGQPALHWEQISAATMLLQQQLQEWRGELKSADGSQERPSSGTLAPSSANPVTPIPGNAPSSGKGQQVLHPLVPGTSAASASSAGNSELDKVVMPQPATNPRSPVQPSNGRSTLSSHSAAQATVVPTRKLEPPVNPIEQSNPIQSKPAPLTPLIERSAPARKTGQFADSAPSSVAPTPLVPARKSVEARGRTTLSSDSGTSPVPVTQSHPRHVSSSDNGIASTSQRDMMVVGEDDLAIFEQMRHQLILWLRIEAVSANLEIVGQGPAQLLEMLRQQSRIDETRLQVISTLLNLANQVLKTGVVTVLDYKQALMFYLMHTRRF
jgi:hypothetical protein